MTIPAEVRAAVLRRAGGVCETCGDTPVELHHLRYWYDTGWKHETAPIDGHETVDDLAALCRECHHARHVDYNGTFYRDPEDKADAWFGFHWEMDKP